MRSVAYAGPDETFARAALVDGIERVDDPVGEPRARPEILDVDDAEAGRALDEHLALGRVEHVVDDEARPVAAELREVGREVRLRALLVAVLVDQLADERVAVDEQEAQLLVGELVGELQAVVDVARADAGVGAQAKDDRAALDAPAREHEVVVGLDRQALVGRRSRTARGAR